MRRPRGHLSGVILNGVTACLFHRPVLRDEPSRSEESLCGVELEGAAVQTVSPSSPIPPEESLCGLSPVPHSLPARKSVFPSVGSGQPRAGIKPLPDKYLYKLNQPGKYSLLHRASWRWLARLHPESSGRLRASHQA